MPERQQCHPEPGSPLYNELVEEAVKLLQLQDTGQIQDAQREIYSAVSQHRLLSEHRLSTETDARRSRPNAKEIKAFAEAVDNLLGRMDGLTDLSFDAVFGPRDFDAVFGPRDFDAVFGPRDEEGTQRAEKLRQELKLLRREATWRLSELSGTLVKRTITFEPGSDRITSIEEEELPPRYPGGRPPNEANRMLVVDCVSIFTSYRPGNPKDLPESDSKLIDEVPEAKHVWGWGATDEADFREFVSFCYELATGILGADLKNAIGYVLELLKHPREVRKKKPKPPKYYFD